jgi:hypothetical protein
MAARKVIDLDEVPDTQVDHDDVEVQHENQHDDMEQVQNAYIVLESMLTKLPSNKYTQALQTDIDQAKVECALILSVSVDSSDDNPEETAAHAVRIRIQQLMESFGEIKDMYESIMNPRQRVKRSASDPPEPGSDEPGSSSSKYMRSRTMTADDDADNADDEFENSQQT